MTAIGAVAPAGRAAVLAVVERGSDDARLERRVQVSVFVKVTPGDESVEL